MNKQQHTDPRTRSIYLVTLVGALVNVALTLIKLVVGFLGHSAALIADAVHSLSDFCTDIVVTLFVGIAGKPRDTKYRYGYGKYESIATLIIAAVLMGIGISMLLKSGEAIYLFFASGVVPQRPSLWAAIIAFISVLSKEWLFRYTKGVAERVHSNTVLANAWHHRTDAYSSIAVLVGVLGAALLGNKWAILDQVACAGVSFFIVWAGVQLISTPWRELTEHSLSEEEQQTILEIIEAEYPGHHPHNLNTRSLGSAIAIEVDIYLPDETPVILAHERATHIENKLKEHYGERTHVVVHVEPIAMMNTDHE